MNTKHIVSTIRIAEHPCDWESVPLDRTKPDFTVKRSLAYVYNAPISGVLKSATIDSRIAPFFHVHAFHVAHVSLLQGRTPAIAFDPTRTMVPFAINQQLNAGMSITVQAELSWSARLCVSVRDGAELPEDYREIQLQLRRLHPKHPKSVGEVDIAYDWDWKFPSWALGRVAGEAPIGEEVIEDEVDGFLLENLRFEITFRIESAPTFQRAPFRGIDPGDLG